MSVVGYQALRPFGSPRSDHPAGIRLLSQDVAAICSGRGGATTSCRIDIVASPWLDPLLAWYLRDATTRWVLSPPGETRDGGHRLLVTPADPEDAEGGGWARLLPAHYVGSQYRTGGSGLAARNVVLWVPRERAE
jgi:hypothetical protein